MATIPIKPHTQINDLPFEIMSHLFHATLPSYDQVELFNNLGTAASETANVIRVLLSICKHWAFVAQNTPRLWTFVHWDGLHGTQTYSESEKAFEARLFFSKALPIYLILGHPLRMHDRNPSSLNEHICVMRDLIMQHSKRVRYLHWSYPNLHLWPEYAHWDILESFYLRTAVDFPIFNHTPPLLSSLYVHAAGSYSVMSPYPDLSALDCSRLKKLTLEAVVDSSWSRFISQCEHLEELCFRDCTLMEPSAEWRASSVQQYGAVIITGRGIYPFAPSVVHLHLNRPSAVVAESTAFPLLESLHITDIGGDFRRDKEPEKFITRAPRLRAFSYVTDMELKNAAKLIAAIRNVLMHQPSNHQIYFQSETSPITLAKPEQLQYLRHLRIFLFTTFSDRPLEQFQILVDALNTLLAQRPTLDVELIFSGPKSRELVYHSGALMAEWLGRLTVRSADEIDAARIDAFTVSPWFLKEVLTERYDV